MSFIVSNTYDIHATASLDLQFANKKSLVDQISGRNLIDHTRQSSATYVGSDGLIKTAVTNLLTYSEDGSQSNWTHSPGTITPDATLSPDNTLTADKIVINNGASAGDAYLQAYTITANAVSTVSGYFKAGEFEAVQLGSSQGGNGFFAIYNLTTGVKISSGALGTGTLTNESVESVGNGWYRISVSGTITAGVTNGAWRITIKNSSGTTVTGDGTSGIFVWGAQAEQSSTVGEYVKTTTAKNGAPRFDHDPATGESLGLLVEESRTNLILNSDTNVELSNGASPNTWTSGEIAPDGSATAKICTTNNRSWINYAASGTANSPITYSVYLKATSSISRQLQLRKFNTDTIVTDIPSINLTTEWKRFEITGTSDTDGARIEILGGIENISAWGAQLEAGSFPTSYIPTEGSTVTRAEDVASISGSNFSSWYRQDEGTLYVDALPVPTSGFPSSVVSIDDNTINNRIEIIKNNNQCPLATIIYEGTGQESLTDAAATFAQQSQVAFGFMQDDQALYQGGSLVESDLSITMPTVNRMRIGLRITDDEYLNGTISRLTYWPTRLLNDTLQTITA